jgi:hypothetical protein
VEHLEAVAVRFLFVDPQTQMRIQSGELHFHVNLDGQHLLEGLFEISAAYLLEWHFVWGDVLNLGLDHLHLQQSIA